jgi:hypothetical protein
MIVAKTSFLIYVILDHQNWKLEFVKECKTKGEALKWIKESGAKDLSYTVQELFKP